MTELIFRNVDVSPCDPVEVWPLEAIQAALERGSLKHWRRLAAAIKAAPWGPVSRDVEEVLTYSRPYGVAKTMERVIEQARRDTETAERAVVVTEIQQLIEESGLSRAAFASRLGTSTRASRPTQPERWCRLQPCWCGCTQLPKRNQVPCPLPMGSFRWPDPGVAASRSATTSIDVADGPDEVHKMVLARRELNCWPSAPRPRRKEPGAAARGADGLASGRLPSTSDADRQRRS